MRLSFVFLAVVVAFIGGYLATPLLAPAPSPPAGNGATAADGRLATTYAMIEVETVAAPHVEASSAGALARLGERLLLLTADGAIHILRLDRSGFERLELPLPLDRAAAQALFERQKDKNSVGAEGLAVRRAAEGWELFVSHTRAHPGESCITLAVSRIRLAEEGGRLAAAGPWRRIFETAPCLPAPGSFPFQSAGMLAFARDGRLLLAVGDHGYDDVNRSSVLAKVGRDDNDYGKLIAIAPDSGAASRLARGFRNASGLAVDDRGRIWQVEHGPMGGDELNLLEPGGSYGWPGVTYGVQYGSQTWPISPAQGRHPGHRRPVYAWVPSIAVSGLIQLRGDAFPAWRGDLLAGALKTGELVRLRLGEGPRVIVAEPVPLGVRVRALAELAGGEIAVLADGAPGLLILGHAGLVPAPRKTPSVLAACTECHSMTAQGLPGAAPTLQGVWQRRIAGLADADYSPALRARQGKWDRATLAEFLADPQGFAPGTTMPAPGLGPEEIAAVLDALEGLD